MDEPRSDTEKYTRAPRALLVEQRTALVERMEDIARAQIVEWQARLDMITRPDDRMPGVFLGGATLASWSVGPVERGTRAWDRKAAQVRALNSLEAEMLRRIEDRG